MRLLKSFSPTSLFFIILSTVTAQTPGFNYQAVLRDAQGQPMANQNVSLTIRFSDGPEGTLLYQESHAVTTNELGLINVTVGTGLLETGAFDSIVGVPDLYYEIQVEFSDGTNEVLGNGPVGAIPYALYGKDEDSDPTNEMQNLFLDGDSLGIEGGLGVSLKSFESPWKPLEDTSGYILNFPPSVPAQRNSEFVAFLIRCFTNSSVYSLENGDYKISNRLKVGSYNDDKYPDVPIVNGDYSGAFRLKQV